AFGGQSLAVGRKGAVQDRRLVARKNSQCLPRRDVPQAQGAIPTSCGDHFLIGGKPGGRNSVSMSFASPDKAMCGDLAAPPSGVNREGKEPASGREFDGIGVSRQGFQSVNKTAGARFENLDEPKIRQREKITVESN